MAASLFKTPLTCVAPQIFAGFGQARAGWAYVRSTVGYYYYNEHFAFGGMEVVFEVSSYEALQARVAAAPEQADKLVFHFNGNLTTDWDPLTSVVGSYLHVRESAATAAMRTCDVRLAW